MKKLIPILIAALLLALLPVTALAGHHRGHRSHTNYQVTELCPIDDCQLTQRHYHDGCAYAGHYYGDGHDFHEQCAVRGCGYLYQHGHNSYDRGGRGAGCCASSGAGY